MAAEVAPAAPPAKKMVYRRRSGVGELIVRTVATSKERGGVSLAALKKALAASGYDVEKNRARIKRAVKGLVAKGTLVQVKGTGASGSFRMSKKVDDKPKRAAKKAAPKTKKPAAKKPAAAKKPKAAAKKPVTPKKSPKKAKKPAKKTAVKSLKKTKSPKKAPKKTPTKKSPAARKAPAKKVVKAKKAAPKKK